MSRRSRRVIAGLEATGVHALLRGALRWKGVVVLCHHRIGVAADTVGDPALFSATPDELDRQLTALRRHTDVIGPEDLEAAARERSGRCALVTFDDGYRDLHDVALPVLAAHGVRAAMFVASSFVDRPRMPFWDELHWMARESGREPEARGWVEAAKRRDPGGIERLLDDVGARVGCGRAPAGVGADDWCTWGQVRALRDAGMTIGGHTDTHPILARCAPAVQEREIRRGLDRLEAELGTRPGLFAYPVGSAGSFDEHSRRAVARAGLRAAFSFYEGANPWATWDPLDVRRIWPPRPPELVGIRASLPSLYVRSPPAPAAQPARPAAAAASALAHAGGASAGAASAGGASAGAASAGAASAGATAAAASVPAGAAAVTRPAGARDGARRPSRGRPGR